MTKRGPTPSRASRDRRRSRVASLQRAFPREREMVVRVRCGCGAVMFNPHASGDDRKTGDPRWLEPCPICGAECAAYHDVALAPAAMFEPAPGAVRLSS